MKYQFSALSAFLLVTVGLAHADGDIYKCVNANGGIEYRNTGTIKGCSKVDVQSPTMIAAPAPAKHSSDSVKTASLKSSSSANSFPQVDGGTQKARDNDRRQILLDEMKNEQDKLVSLKKDYNNGEPERRSNESNAAKYQERVAAMKDDIARAEKNIEALQRELKREGGDSIK